MKQHIITRRASKKNSAKEVVEYTVDGETMFKYVGAKGHTKAGFDHARNLATNAAWEGENTIVVRDLR